jgi:hypothetical protein
MAKREQPPGAGEPPEDDQPPNGEQPAPAPGPGSMRSAAFAVFFNDLMSMATDPTREAVSPREVLRKHGLDLDLPPEVERQIGPLLSDSPGAIRAKVDPNKPRPKPKCGVCGVCGTCALCGEINL